MKEGDVIRFGRIPFKIALLKLDFDERDNNLSVSADELAGNTPGMGKGDVSHDPMLLNRFGSVGDISVIDSARG